MPEEYENTNLDQEQEFVDDESLDTEQEYIDYDQVLEEYRRRQMIEHLTGPMISLVLHVIVVILCAIFLVGDQTRKETAEIEFDVKEIEVKPIDKEKLDELDELEQEVVDDPVPTIEKPDIPPEVVEAATTEDFTDAMASSELDMDFAVDLNVRSNTSPIALAGVFAGRSAAKRGEAIKKHGGRYGQIAEVAVLKALEWLKNNQNPDGSWNKNYQGSMTALALLAYLAHNETQTSENYGVTVQKALQWLVNRVNTGKRFSKHGYSNGIVAYALSEAYAMTGKMPIIKPAMDRAITNIVKGQQAGGGFDYSYKKGDRWDLSVAAWQMQAMKAAYAAGCDVDGLQEAIAKGIDFIKNTAYKNGRFGYSSPGSGRMAMTAAGTLALQLLGEGDSSEAKKALDSMSTLAPQWRANDFAHGASYGWYYATQAKFHGGRRHFDDWNKLFVPILVSNQQADGHWGSPIALDDKEDHAAGSAYEKVYNTALNALSLMVYYRYLPSYQEPEKQEEKKDIFSMDF